MQCPDRNQDDVTHMVHELVLQNCNDTVLQPFLSGTWLAAVLDSGASITVYKRSGLSKTLIAHHQSNQLRQLTPTTQNHFDLELVGNGNC